MVKSPGYKSLQYGIQKNSGITIKLLAGNESLAEKERLDPVKRKRNIYTPNERLDYYLL